MKRSIGVVTGRLGRMVKSFTGYMEHQKNTVYSKGDHFQVVLRCHKNPLHSPPFRPPKP